MSNRHTNFAKQLEKELKGKKIKSIDLMSESEAEDMFWDQRAFVITLDDGTRLIPQRDDEGNGPGALFIEVKPETKEGYLAYTV